LDGKLNAWMIVQVGEEFGRHGDGINDGYFFAVTVWDIFGGRL
jgi:hypothetical protein